MSLDEFAGVLLGPEATGTDLCSQVIAPVAVPVLWMDKDGERGCKLYGNTTVHTIWYPGT